MDNLLELERKFNNTGIRGPVITNNELKNLLKKYNELYEYFYTNGEKIMAYHFINKKNCIVRMLQARGENV